MPVGTVTKNFGPEIHTAYSGNALNRLSFLREDIEFLNRAFHSPDALFLPFKASSPLLFNKSRLHWVKAEQLPGILGEPFLLDLETAAKRFKPEIDGSGCSTGQLVFLGVDDAAGGFSGHDEYPGAPRFAVDVTEHPHALPHLRKSLDNFNQWVESTEGLEFDNTYHGKGLKFEDPNEFSIIAEGRILTDWINRVRFCAGCGNRNMPAWGGFKLLCPLSITDEAVCPTKNQVTYLSFPRTDCCVIVAVVSHNGQEVLIGRGKRFRTNMYSCLAGFLEGGESIEDCVRREVFEESGVKVGTVHMVASQPWPFPANIMIGCIAEVIDEDAKSHEIFLGHDKELLDAKWVPKADLLKLVGGSTEFGYSLPPQFSIAWSLLDQASKFLN